LQAIEDELGATWRQWTSWQCGLTKAETQQVCFLAQRRGELPAIDAAFRSGELSPGVAAALTAVATPDNEAALLETTRCATGAQLEVLVRDYRRARRDARRKVSPEEDPAQAPSTMFAGWSDHGRHRGNFDLRADHGAVMEAAFEQARNEGRLDEAGLSDGLCRSSS